MSQEEIVERISKLEAQLQALSPRRQEPSEAPHRESADSCQIFLSYWTLFSFLFALVVMVYVKYTFDIDYFENYRSVSEIRSLSDFHRKMGDEFIGKTEWQAAEDAYQQALDIEVKIIFRRLTVWLSRKCFNPWKGKSIISLKW